MSSKDPSRTELLGVLNELFKAESREKSLSLLADDIVVTDWMEPGIEIKGKEEVFDRVFEPSEGAFPDSEYRILDTLIDGDKVMVRAEYVGHFNEPYKGMKPTGEKVSWFVHDIFQIQNGKVVQIWFGGDTLEAAKQLKAIAAADAPW